MIQIEFPASAFPQPFEVPFAQLSGYTNCPAAGLSFAHKEMTDEHINKPRRMSALVRDRDSTHDDMLTFIFVFTTFVTEDL